MVQREHLVKVGTRRRRGNKLKSVRGVTVHNTGNRDKGANADRHAKYQANTPNDQVNGWHWTVDDKEAVLSIPENEIAEHAGKREGNDTTVGVEICENPDCDIRKATDNAAQLVAEILKRQGFKSAVWKQNIFQHNDWTGKNCPEQIRKGNPYNWQEFLRLVNEHMAGNVPAQKPVTPIQKPVANVVPVFSRPLKNLGKGNYMRGEDVKALQTRLNDLKYNCGKPDGVFGEQTEAAVIAFKKDHAVDGTVDLATWQKIFK